ncbi:MAG: peptidylprolyl isomerase [Pseudomonadota bacterium]
MTRVTLRTSHGDMVWELKDEEAPNTVANFLGYARDRHYEDTLFHRVIEGFVIQGGGFDQRMRRRETGEPIANEAANGLKNKRGTVAMARTRDPHSATDQFFVNVADNDFLDHREPTPDGYGYCVFAEVVSGMEVADAIQGLTTTSVAGHADVPAEPVVLQEVTIHGENSEG